MEKSTEFYTGRHVAFNLHAHLIFVTKYRREAISERVFLLLREVFKTVCEDFGGVLEESNYEEDHVHLLVSYLPKVALSRLVGSLKGVSSRMLRAEKIPEVQSKLWGKHFWSPSYCVASWGGAPLEVLKKYIQEQRAAPKGPGRRKKQP